MKKITFILFALFTCWQINAQVSSYAFSQSNGTYSEITGGTVLGVATNDDTSFNAQPIGFSFVFNGITYTQFSVNSNGFIALGATVSSSYNAISGGTSNNVIAALNGDLNGSATGQLSYQLSGTAPNQVLTIQWKNYRHYNATGDVNNFQIKLYETTNVVGVVYGAFTQNATSRTREVGLRGASNADFNNRSTTTDWAATSTGATNAASCTLTAAVVPTSGLTFTWTPPSCASPAGFVASAITTNSATIAWNVAVPVPSGGYQYYYSTVNTAPSGAGTATSNLTENLTGLSVNTPYYVWLRSDCGGGTFSAWAGPFTFNTTCNSITTLPHAESFDAATNPSCWSTALVSGVTNWAPDDANDGVPAARTGARFAGKSWVGNDNALLISPVYNLAAYSTDQARLNVWIYRSANGLATDKITFYANTANNLTGATMLVDVPLPISSAPVVTSAGWYNYIVDLPLSFNTVGDFYIIAQGRTSSSFSSYGIGFDDYVLELKPSCVEPNSIIASNITSTTVDLSWTDGSGGLQFDYEYAIQAPGTGVPASAGAQVGDVTIAGEGFDINGDPLAANTLYEVYVRSDCGGGDFSPWVGPITFRTLCSTFVAPFNQPFASNTFPSCWSQTGPTAWEFGSNVSTPAGFADYGADLAPDFNAAGGTFIGMDGSDNTDGEVSSLLTPFIDVTPLTTPRLKYAVFGNNVNDAARNLLQVEVWDGAAWNLVNTVSDNLGPNWVVFTTNLSSLTITGPIQIRFTVTGVANGGSTFYHDILIDDVTVEETPVTPPACASNVVATPHPTCGNFNNTISWDAVSGADGYNLTIGTTSGGNDVLNNQNLGSSISYVFAGTVNTTYYYTVTPYNANGPAVGCIERTFTTNTNGCYCVPTYSNGGGGDNITNVVIGSWSNASTGNVLPYYEDFTSQQPTPIAIPTMTAGLNSTVSVTMGTDGTQFSRVWIDFNQNLTFEPSESFSLGTSVGGGGTSNIIVNVPAGATLGVTRMRIRGGDDSAILNTQACGASSSTFGQTEDYLVNILPAPSCLPPTALNATAVTSSSASLGWTEAGTASSWDIEWGTLGFTPTGTPTISGATNPQSISGLNSNTTYSFYVRANCGAGGFSTWSGPFSFTTACVAENVPYSQDFETATVPNLPSCTSQQNVGSGNLWTVENNPGYGFTNKALRYRWNSSNNANVWFYTNGVNLVAGTTYRISYSYGGTGTTFPEKLKVSYGSSANAAAMTNLLADYPNVVNDTPINTFVDFTPSTSGVYYFGFNAYSDADQFYLIVDNILVDVALSSGSFDNANFSAYPNPVKDVLNVSYSTEISSIRVINMIGQEVISKNINATSTQVDMSQLSAGTYIVNVTVGDNVKTLKVVKQ